MKMNLQYAAELMQGQLRGASCSFEKISTDTRNIGRGELFFALRGENFNGEAFVERAQIAGACAAVVTRWQQDLNFPQVLVDDTTLALGRLACGWRKQLKAKVVSITGSCGKTSVKGMLRQICSLAGPSLATHANLNNHIGVPLTLLAATEGLDYLIVEAGTSGKGEIAYLSSLITADISLLINVHPAHLQGFGTLDAIASEKAEIYNYMAPEPIRVINESLLDYSAIHAHLDSSQVLLFSEDSHSNAAVKVIDYSLNHSGCLNFDLSVDGRQYRVVLNVPGLHQLENALAAAACAIAMGIDEEYIIQGLANYHGEPGRMQFSSVLASTLIDDSYNANPASMKAAIDYLSAQQNPLLVLGDMAELGENAEFIHRELGRYAAASGIKEVFVVGTFADDYADGFGPTTHKFNNHDELVGELQQRMAEALTVLVKGSRSSAMDKVCRALQQGGEK